MPRLDILIPTFRRPAELALTQTGLYYQNFIDYRLIVSDQTEESDPLRTPAVMTALNLHRAAGRLVDVHKHLPRLGMAEQRQFLLERAEAERVLFLDDDLLLEPWAVQIMVGAMDRFRCGFVGQAPIGLSYIDDLRPDEQHVEFWETAVEPESVSPNDPAWQRYRLHNAANIYHLQRAMQITPDTPRPYKIAWVGGCVLYDRAKLLDVGGFNFWRNLPHGHVGEDVQAQLLVAERYGGCGLIPSGVYHLESPTTLADRQYNAPEYLRSGETGDPSG